MRKKHRDLFVKLMEERRSARNKRFDAIGETKAAKEFYNWVTEGEEGGLLLIFITIQAIDGH